MDHASPTNTLASNLVSSQNTAVQFVGGGQMGEMIRNYDWDGHPLGDPSQWPLSLKTGIRIMLHSKHPIFIWWTREMYMFHNDAYVPLMGNKHPQGLGAKGYQVWAETWSQLGAVLEGILEGKEAFYGEELRVVMNRKGYMDETFWTFSYSAMPDDEGKVNGIFCACNEVTESVLAKRRMRIIKDLSQAIVGQPTVAQTFEKACQVMGEDISDIPFAIFYQLDEEGKQAKLMAHTGSLPDVLLSPVIDLNIHTNSNLWPLAEVFSRREAVVVELPMASTSAELRSPKAAVLPIHKSGGQYIHGFLIAGLSRHLEYDEVYKDFHVMLTRQIASTLSSLHAKSQAEQQRKRLQDLFMQAPAAICILSGKELVYELVNPLYEQLFPGRLLAGKPILEALPEIAGTRVAQTFREVFETGQTHEEKEILIPIINQKGVLEDRYFRYIQQARYNLSGHIDGVVVFALEITDQVVARQKVEQSEKQLRLITDSLPVLIGYLDKEEKYRFANLAYQSWFNQAPEALLGRPVLEVVGDKAYTGVKGYIKRALAGERIDFEAKMPYRENFNKYIRTSYVPDVQSGEVAGFYTLVTDVTEQVEARNEVERQRSQFQLLLESIPQITWMGLPNGELSFFNSRWYTYTGLNHEQSKGWGWEKVVHPQDLAYAHKTYLHSINTGEDCEMELRLKRGKNGEHRWFLVRMLPLLNEQGTITGWVGTGTDIHEKKQLEDDLKQSQQELAATNEKLQASNEDLTQSNQQLAYINADMDNFIYTASHDLKAPINNIEGLMKALLRQLSQESLNDPRVNKTISYIQEAVERFKRTIASLTEVVKLQKDNNQVVMQVNLRKLLEEVKLDLLPLITETSAHIVLDLDTCPSIEFAEKNLRSILYNLLSNAIKYRSGERPPVVRVSCQTNGAYKILTVEDNGLGMDLTGEGKLFSMFTRLHSHVEGSGIGLYMVKKIIDNAGGKIEVESEVGTGSIFKVYFKQY